MAVLLLGGKTLAPLGAPGGENPATADGGHAGAESMTPFADQFAWLISAFHWAILLFSSP
jgi:hypothetical protein